MTRRAALRILFSTLALVVFTVVLQVQPQTVAVQAVSDWTQLAIVGVACVSAALAAHRERGQGRWFWLGVAGAVAIWAVGQMRYIWLGSIFFQGADTLQTVLFLVMGLPLLPALALQPDDPAAQSDQRALDVAIVSVLATFIYFYIALSVPAATTSEAYATWRVAAGWLVSGAVPIGFVLRYRTARQPWRRLYAELGIACAVWFLGDAVLTKLTFDNEYRAGMMDLPWLLPFAWIAVIGADWRPPPTTAAQAIVWRDTRYGAVLALGAVASPLVLHLVLTSLADHPDAWEARTIVTLVTAVLVVGLFLTRQLRTLSAFEAEEIGRQRQRRALEERFSRAFHALPLGAVILTDDGEHVVDANDRALDLLGLSRPAMGRAVALLEGVTQGVLSGTDARGRPVTLARDDGEKVETRVWAQPLATGGDRSMLVLLQDPRATRRLERQVVQARNAETVGRLAGSIAHDLNNLLTAIVGSTEVARLHLDDVAALREDLEHVVHAAGRAAALTGRLLEYGRGQAEAAQAIDVVAIVASTERTTRTLAGASVAVRFDLAGGPLRVEIDPSELERILVNLVVNARDAMRTGGTLRVSLDVVDRAGAAAVNAGITPGRYAALVVADSGQGIDQSLIPRIFEPFFTTKGPEGGVGLGLPSVLASARRVGGGVEVISTIDVGTSVTVLLPLAEDAPRPATSHVARGEMPRGTEVVLLVEDEDAVREVVRRVLERLGYRVLEASSGPRALELARRWDGRIALLLTDVIMPEMNGAQLAATLVAERPDIRVLYASGYAADVLGPMGMASGDLDLIRKPFTPAELAARVRMALDRPSPAS
jgi:two-component system cell cycle sensor histidine kinase/response regulator CckA